MLANLKNYWDKRVLVATNRADYLRLTGKEAPAYNPYSPLQYYWMPSMQAVPLTTAALVNVPTRQPDGSYAVITSATYAFMLREPNLPSERAEEPVVWSMGENEVPIRALDPATETLVTDIAGPHVVVKSADLTMEQKIDALYDKLVKGA